MTGNHGLTEDERKWLLVLATPRKTFLAKTVPRAVHSALLANGLIAIVHGLPRATTEGKAELVRLIL